MDAMLVSDAGDLPYVDECQCGIGRRLDPNQLCRWADQLCDVNLDAGTESHFDIVCSCDFGEVAMRAAIDIRDGDDVGASGERLQDRSGRCGTRGEGEGETGVLESCDGALEIISVYVSEYETTGIRLTIAYLLGFDEREYSYCPTGFPTLVCAKVVDSEI